MPEHWPGAREAWVWGNSSDTNLSKGLNFWNLSFLIYKMNILKLPVTFKLHSMEHRGFRGNMFKSAMESKETPTDTPSTVIPSHRLHCFSISLVLKSDIKNKDFCGTKKLIMGLEDLQELCQYSLLVLVPLALSVSWEADLAGWATSLCSAFLLSLANRRSSRKRKNGRR